MRNRVPVTNYFASNRNIIAFVEQNTDLLCFMWIIIIYYISFDYAFVHNSSIDAHMKHHRIVKNQPYKCISKYKMNEEK